jgi:hypothetical protein
MPVAWVVGAFLLGRSTCGEAGRVSPEPDPAAVGNGAMVLVGVAGHDRDGRDHRRPRAGIARPDRHQVQRESRVVGSRSWLPEGFPTGGPGRPGGSCSWVHPTSGPSRCSDPCLEGPAGVAGEAPRLIGPERATGITWATGSRVSHSVQRRFCGASGPWPGRWSPQNQPGPTVQSTGAGGASDGCPRMHRHGSRRLAGPNRSEARDPCTPSGSRRCCGRRPPPRVGPRTDEVRAPHPWVRRTAAPGWGRAVGWSGHRVPDSEWRHESPV